MVIFHSYVNVYQRVDDIPGNYPGGHLGGHRFGGKLQDQLAHGVLIPTRGARKGARNVGNFSSFLVLIIQQSRGKNSQ